MRRVYQIASLVFLAFSIYLVVKSRDMEYFATLGPGAGFFPFWLGSLLAVLSLIWLVQSSLGPKEPMEADFIPTRQGVIRVISVVAALALFSWLVETFGFQLTMLVFLATLLVTLGRQKLIVTAAVAIGGSFGIYYIFTKWLDVSLPASSIDFLRNLGL
jgi:putative tricarboxylic transport membrane protein